MSVGVAWPNGRYPNVLHVIASLAVGGTETQLTGFIARSTEPSRRRVAVFDRFVPLADRLPNQPIWLGRISRRPEEMAANLRTAVRLRRVVRQGAFDLVHAHLGLSEVLAVVVPRSVPVVRLGRCQLPSIQTGRSLPPLVPPAPRAAPRGSRNACGRWSGARLCGAAHDRARAG